MFSRVASLFHDLDAGMLPISVLFPYAPIAPHRARDAARAELARVFAAVIAARRAAAKDGSAAPPEDDILQSFIDARYSPSVHGGRSLTDGEITGLLIACLFAGQHTSSITSSWTGYLMLSHRAAALEPALAEQARLLAKHGDALDIGVLGEMDALHANITEAIRLFPPLIMLLRLAKKPFRVATSTGQAFTVPAGDMVFASPAFSHRLPHVFPRADEYEPARFGPGRAEDKKGEPFSFIGFGGGR
jgi:sterol 14-demethylase